MLVKALADVINHALSVHPQLQQRLADFAGKSIGVVATTPPLNLLLKIQHHGIEVELNAAQTADCVVSGSAIALAKYARAEQINPATHAELGVSIEGDLDLAHQLSRVLRDFDIDWPEVLSPVMNDFVGYQFGKNLQGLAATFKRSKESAAEHIKYLVKDKLDQLVARQEAENFYQDVDDLFAAVQRLEAKIRQLDSK